MGPAVILSSALPDLQFVLFAVCVRGAVAREDASWQSWAQREVRVAGASGNEYRSRRMRSVARRVRKCLWNVRCGKRE